MYQAMEHLYQEDDPPYFYEKEFVVREATCTRVIEPNRKLGRRRWEAHMRGKNAGGHMTPYAMFPDQIGERWFWTAKEAAEKCRELTMKEESSAYMKNRPQMRRPWADLLEDL